MWFKWYFLILFPSYSESLILSLSLSYYSRKSEIDRYYLTCLRSHIQEMQKLECECKSTRLQNLCSSCITLECSGIKVRATVSLILGKMGKRGLGGVSASLNSIICLCLKWNLYYKSMFFYKWKFKYIYTYICVSAYIHRHISQVSLSEKFCTSSVKFCNSCFDSTIHSHC